MPIPSFVPVPGAETMRLISIIALIAGICLAAAGGVVLLVNKRKGKEKNTLAWVLIWVGVLLTIDHSVQLIF